MCDPGTKAGIAKQFDNSEDLDDWINFFCSNLDPKFFKSWRIFITNDNVDFPTLDHYVLMDEYMEINDSKGIEEVVIHERALTGNTELLSRTRKLSELREKASRASIERAKDLEENRQSYLRDLE